VSVAQGEVRTTCTDDNADSRYQFPPDVNRELPAQKRKESAANRAGFVILHWKQRLGNLNRGRIR
jgi:hypothetical protein